MVKSVYEVIEEARENVANLINAQSSEIIFTPSSSQFFLLFIVIPNFNYY